VRGNIWAREKQVCFVLYCVLLGPPIGFFLLLLTLSFLQQKWVLLHQSGYENLLFISYYFGGLQAFLTAVLICWRYARGATIRLSDFVLCIVVGWLFGNLTHYDFALNMIEGRDAVFGNDFYLMTFSPLIFGAFLTMVMWYVRPKKWVGP